MSGGIANSGGQSLRVSSSVEIVPFFVKIIGPLTLLGFIARPVYVQSASVNVNAATTGVRIGVLHYGIFYEELNHAGNAASGRS